jgi:hypothetical protein
VYTRVPPGCEHGSASFSPIPRTTIETASSSRQQRTPAFLAWASRHYAGLAQRILGKKRSPKTPRCRCGTPIPGQHLQYYQQSIPESVKRAAVALEAEILKKAERRRDNQEIKTSAKVVN